jgi:protein phosphatase
VRDEELARIAIAHADPDEACAQLIALANERGGSDNISVIVARTEGD